MADKSIIMRICISLSMTLTIMTATYASDNMIEVKTPEGRVVKVTAINDNVIKVSNLGRGEVEPVSRAVVASSDPVKASVTGITDDISMLSTGSGIVATVDSRTGSVTINGGPDRIIVDNGLRPATGGHRSISLTTTSKGSYYGAGERGHSLNLRGDTLTMYNRQNYGYTKGDPRIDQMNISMPLFISSDGFALLFDDYAAAEMILGKDTSIRYVTENDRPVSFYFVNGASTIADVTEQLTAITGRQDLPPFWSLGYITSKYGYKTQKEAMGVIDTLKSCGYPVDGIVLDLYWYGKEQDMGRLEWEPRQWPDPEKMLSALKRKGVNMVIISQPYVLRNGKAIDNYRYLASKGMFVSDSTGRSPQEVKIWVGEGGMFDVSNPDTRSWLRRRYKALTDMGVAGWWGDLGEPEVHPESGLHHNGRTARLYHNQYGNDWSEIIYDLFKEDYPGTRLLTMMRGGTTGLQRYSVFPWSTDVSRSWGGLQPQVTIMLNSGLSGLGYMGHDVGGFAVDNEHPVDPELYVRWLQLGAFSPMLRTHAQHMAEPYKYRDMEPIILPLIKERYRWLPYNYTLAWENATKGYPLVRPLNFHEAGSNAYDNIDDEYLWGGDVLVAPVMTQGATSRQITFPKGMWVDFNSPTEVYSGGTTINYPAPLEVLPLFVKAGSFIPMAVYGMKSTRDYDPSRYTVRYFPVDNVDSEYTLFEDDRSSAGSLDDGQYRLLTFKGTDDGRSVGISLSSEGAYPGAPSSYRISLVVNNMKQSPGSVTINGKKVAAKYDADRSAVTIDFTWMPANPATININK